MTTKIKNKPLRERLPHTLYTKEVVMAFIDEHCTKIPDMKNFLPQFSRSHHVADKEVVLHLLFKMYNPFTHNMTCKWIHRLPPALYNDFDVMQALLEVLMYDPYSDHPTSESKMTRALRVMQSNGCNVGLKLRKDMRWRLLIGDL